MNKFYNFLKTFLLLLVVNSISTSFSQNPSELIKKINDSTYILKDIEINVNSKSISIPCKINMDKGLIEVVLCTAKGKTHESLLVSKSGALEFQTALLLLGLDPINEVPENKDLIPKNSPFQTIETPGDSVQLFLSYQNSQGAFYKPIELFIKSASDNKPIDKISWLFLGAVTHYTGHVLADPETTIIATFHDALALMEINNSSKYDDTLYYVNETETPPKGTEVKLIVKSLK